MLSPVLYTQQIHCMPQNTVGERNRGSEHAIDYSFSVSVHGACNRTEYKIRYVNLT